MYTCYLVYTNQKVNLIDIKFCPHNMIIIKAVLKFYKLAIHGVNYNEKFTLHSYLQPFSAHLEYLSKLKKKYHTDAE